MNFKEHLSKDKQSILIEKLKGFAKANKLADEKYGEFGVASLDDEQMSSIIDIKKADKIADTKYGEFGFSTLSEDEMEEILNSNPKLVKESLTEKKIQLKRGYTQNHPATTVGISAKIRNKVLEAIKDGKISKSEYDEIVSELSNDSKRWSTRNSKYFSVSEEGIALSKFGMKVFNSITVNEKKGENPEIWVPGSFDKAISKFPNSQISLDVVTKLAKKHKVELEDAIAYVEYGWDLELKENKINMENTKLVFESFNEFVNSLNESNLTSDEALNEAFKSSKLRNILTMSLANGYENQKDLAKRFYEYTNIKLDLVDDSHILDMDMKDTFKASKDNDRVIFYVVDTEKESPYGDDNANNIYPGLLAISRGKDFLGLNTKGRGYSSGVNTLSTKGQDLGVDKRYKGYGASGLYSVKRIIEVADRAYSISISSLQALLGSAGKKEERRAAKSGALSFKSDRDFSSENRKRYEEILANKASKLPLDKLVKEAIEAMATQIKAGIDSKETGRYGDPIIGSSKKGKEVKLRDAAAHMSSILDDYSRYVDYVKQEKEVTDKYGSAESWYAKSVKEYAKKTMDKIKQIDDMSYAW
jgi:hypothetical protein